MSGQQSFHYHRRYHRSDHKKKNNNSVLIENNPYCILPLSIAKEAYMINLALKLYLLI